MCIVDWLGGGGPRVAALPRDGGTEASCCWCLDCGRLAPALSGHEDVTQLCEPSNRRVAFQWQKQKAIHNLSLCCKHMQPRAPLYTTEKPEQIFEAPGSPPRWPQCRSNYQPPATGRPPQTGSTGHHQTGGEHC